MNIFSSIAALLLLWSIKNELKIWLLSWVALRYFQNIYFSTICAEFIFCIIRELRSKTHLKTNWISYSLGRVLNCSSHYYFLILDSLLNLLVLKSWMSSVTTQWKDPSKRSIPDRKANKTKLLINIGNYAHEQILSEPHVNHYVHVCLNVKVQKANQKFFDWFSFTLL